MGAGKSALDRRQIHEDYRVLGLEVGAPLAEARRAFRRLVKLWHPDVSEQPLELAERETHRLYEAFGRLRSLSARDVADLGGAPTPRPAHRKAAHRKPAPRVRGARPGRDVVGDLVMTRQQARQGSRWHLRVATCHRCAGWGDAAGNRLRVCSECSGLGLRSLGEGGWDLDAVCPHCRGHGCLVGEPCTACDAWGDSGFYLVRCVVPELDPDRVAYRWVPGQGHPGLGGAPAGDLYLRITSRREHSTQGGGR